MPMGHGWSSWPEYDDDHGWSCCGARGGHRRDCPLWQPGDPVGEGGFEPKRTGPSETSQPTNLPGAGRPDPWRTYKEGSSSSLGDDPRFCGNFLSADQLRELYEARQNSDSPGDDPWLAVAELEQRARGGEWPGPSLADWEEVADDPPDGADPAAWRWFVLEKRERFLDERTKELSKRSPEGSTGSGTSDASDWAGRILLVLLFGGMLMALVPSLESVGVAIGSVALLGAFLWGMIRYVAQHGEGVANGDS